MTTQQVLLYCSGILLCVFGFCFSKRKNSDGLTTFLLFVVGILFMCMATCSQASEDPTYQLRTETTTSNVTNHGSAIAINEHMLVTCEHLVNQKEQEIFIKVGKDWLHCEVVKTNKRLDVAILFCFAKLESLEVAKSGEITLCKCFGTKEDKKIEPCDCKVDENGKLVTTKVEVLSHGSSGNALVSGDKIIGMVTGIFNDKSIAWIGGEEINGIVKEGKK